MKRRLFFHLALALPVILLAACAPAPVTEPPEIGEFAAVPDGPPPLASMQVEVSLLAVQPCFGVTPYLILRIDNVGDLPVRSLDLAVQSLDGPQATMEAFLGTPSPTPGIEWQGEASRLFYAQFLGLVNPLEQIDNNQPVGCVQDELEQIAPGGHAFSGIGFGGSGLGSQHTLYYLACSGEGGGGTCVEGAIPFSTPFQLVFISDWYGTALMDINCFNSPDDGAQQTGRLLEGEVARVLYHPDGEYGDGGWGQFELPGGEQCWMDLGVLVYPSEAAEHPFDPQPVAELTETGQPLSACVYSALIALFCRQGPGSEYLERDTFNPGDTAEVIGQSPDGLYSYVIGPYNGVVCAVPNGEPWGQLSASCEPEALPAFTPPPTDTPEPTQPEQPPPPPTATPTFTIEPPR